LTFEFFETTKSRFRLVSYVDADELDARIARYQFADQFAIGRID
jgi:hypothetical protein